MRWTVVIEALEEGVSVTHIPLIILESIPYS